MQSTTEVDKLCFKSNFDAEQTKYCNENTINNTNSFGTKVSQINSLQNLNEINLILTTFDQISLLTKILPVVKFIA